MIIALKNGEAQLKDFCPHKIKKGINKILYAGVTLNSDGKSEGFSMEKMEQANDYAMRQMIDQITIDEKIVEVTTESIDDLPEEDYTKILVYIDGITKKLIPKD